MSSTCTFPGCDHNALRGDTLCGMHRQQAKDGMVTVFSGSDEMLGREFQQIERERGAKAA